MKIPGYAMWALCVLGLLGMFAESQAFWKDDENEEIEELMEKLHEGKKSPYKQVANTLASNTPDWAALTQHLNGFTKMSKMLKEAKNEKISDASDGYHDSVAALLKSVKAKDLPTARKAFENLSQSCADCHYQDGPGGKLK